MFSFFSSMGKVTPCGILCMNCGGRLRTTPGKSLIRRTLFSFLITSFMLYFCHHGNKAVTNHNKDSLINVLKTLVCLRFNGYRLP